jgi:hypothetical protein
MTAVPFGAGPGLTLPIALGIALCLAVALAAVLGVIHDRRHR